MLGGAAEALEKAVDDVEEAQRYVYRLEAKAAEGTDVELSGVLAEVVGTTRH